MILQCPNCHKSVETQAGSIGITCPACGYVDEQTASDWDQTLSGRDSVHVTTDKSESSSSSGKEWVGKEIGDYSIIDKLGQGGMGLVLLAIQKSAERKVALKVIRDDLMHDLDESRAEESVARFKSEAMAAARLEHEHIVTVYEVGQLEGYHYFSMQLVTGKSLGQIGKSRQLAPREVARFIVPICRALQHAHSHGILHRDIKPGNIMVDQEGRPFLTDFGLAKWFEDDDHSMTRSGQIVGTASYMSPQQAIDSSQATIACDVYSLGATIYRLLTGRPPFDQGSLVEVLRQVIHEPPVPPSRICKTIDSDMDTIVLKCLEKEPAKRYRTADELGDELKRFLDGEPIMARPIKRRERFWRWCKRKPLIASLAASAIVLLLSTVVASTVGYINVSKANEDTRKNLRSALLAQAIGMQSSTEAGRRERALTALTEAAEIEPGVDLRNEYARYLDQPDIEEIRDIQVPGWKSNGNSYAEAIANTDRIIAVPDGGNPIEIDSQTGQIVKNFQELGPFQRGFVRNSSFLAKISNNGEYLAGNSNTGRAVEIWDFRSLKKLGELKNENGVPVDLESLVFHPQGSSIFCAGYADQSNAAIQFYRYSLPELELLESWQNQAVSVDCLRIVNDEFLIARLGDEVERVVIWKQVKGSKKTEEINEIPFSDAKSNENLERGIAIDMEFQRIYCGDANGYFGFREFPSGDPIDQALLGRHAKSVTAIDISPDGRWVISCGQDRELKIWDKISGNIVAEIKIDADRAINAQWFSGGSKLLADSENGIKIWRFLQPISKQLLAKDMDGRPLLGVTPFALRFSPQGDSLFYSCAGFLGRLDLSKIDDGFVSLKSEEAGSEIFVSQTGKQYALYTPFLTNDQPLKIYSVDSPQAVQSIEKNAKAPIVDLTETTDGRIIVTEFQNAELLTVNQLNPEKVLYQHELEGRGGFAQAFVTSSGDRIALLSSESGMFDIFDLNTGAVVFQTKMEWQELRMTLHGDLLLYRDDTNLVIVDVESGKKLNKLPLKVKPTNRFEISGDGQFVVVMDESDGRIDLHDTEGNLQLRLYHKEVSPVWIAISNTGKWLAVCDSIGAVKIWDLELLRSELRNGGVLPAN